MRAEPVAEAVDQGAQGVDGEAGLVEPGLGGRAVGVRVGHEVQHRELPEADGVVGDDVGDRDRRQLGPGPEHLARAAPGSTPRRRRPARRRPPGPAAGPPRRSASGPVRGRCSPDGVQRLLTLVSWQEIQSRASGTTRRNHREVGSGSDPHPATGTTQHPRCAGSACRRPAASGCRLTVCMADASRVRHRRVRSGSAAAREVPTVPR